MKHDKSSQKANDINIYFHEINQEHVQVNKVFIVSHVKIRLFFFVSIVDQKGGVQNSDKNVLGSIKKKQSFYKNMNMHLPYHLVSFKTIQRVKWPSIAVVDSRNKYTL